MVEVNEDLYKEVSSYLHDAKLFGQMDLLVGTDRELATDVLAALYGDGCHDRLAEVTACVHEWRETQKTFGVADEARSRTQ
jgi:hypothetical protein